MGNVPRMSSLSIANDPHHIYRTDLPGLRIGIKGTSSSGMTAFDLASVFDCEVTNNNFYMADTWQVEASLSGQKPPFNSPLWWGEQTGIEVKVTASLQPIGPGQGTVLVTGPSDDIGLSLLNDVIILNGRDYTSRFIDTRLSDTFLSIENGKIFLNQTASQLVATLVSDYWPDMQTVITPTKTTVGTYAGAQNALMFRNRSLWDVITWLAQNESAVDASGSADPFVAYIVGKTLYFGPMSGSIGNSGGIFVINWANRSTAKSLDLSRNLTLANDIRVTVQGWGPLGRYQAVASGKHAAAPSTVFPHGYQHYVYTINGLTQQQASNRATSLALSLSQHELTARVEIPADFSLNPYGKVRLTNVALTKKKTVWDTDYWVNACTWRFNLHDGAMMNLWLKNHPTGQQVTL